MGKDLKMRRPTRFVTVMTLAALGAFSVGCNQAASDGAGGTGSTTTGGAGGNGVGGSGVGGSAVGGNGVGGGAGGNAAGGNGTGGAVAIPGVMVYGFNAEALPPGSTYADMTADGIPPFSYSRHSLTLKNEGAADLAVDGFAIAMDPPGIDGEWRVVDPKISQPTDLGQVNATVAPGKGLDFDLYFYPFASGPRSATVKITVGANHDVYSFTTKGRGRDNAELSPDVKSTVETLWGDPKGDGVTSGMATDGAGAAFVSMNVTQWLDGFSNDIGVAGIKKDGSLGWAKTWHEDFDQRSPDPGQNGESGGSADSIAYGAEGGVYVVGRRSQSAANSVFQTFLLRANGATGALDWARGWTPENTPVPSMAKHSSQGYAVSAALADRVLVTGESGSGKLQLVALSKADGSLVWNREIDVAVGSNDRGHAIAADANGNAYIGGLTNGRGLLLRVTGCNTADPKLAWVRKLDMGIGSNINSLAIDPASGDVLASLDRRGATTQFSVARVTAAGDVLWAKTWDDQNSGDNNNTYVVRVNGGEVLVGGRIAFTPFDTQYGEGFLLGLDLADGAYKFGSFYYTGKGAEEMTEHRVKGIATELGQLRVAAQSYTNGLDMDHYWGFWYQAPDYTLELPAGTGALRLADYALAAADVTATSVMTTPAGGVHVLDGKAWVAPQASAVYGPLRERKGAGGDGSMMFNILERLK